MKTQQIQSTQRFIDYQAKLSQAVAYYQPQMEERFAELDHPIELGPVQVSRTKDFALELAKHTHKQVILDIRKAKGYTGPIDRSVNFLTNAYWFSMGYFHEHSKFLEETGKSTFLNNRIFTSSKRSNDPDWMIHKLAVHELAHGYWSLLGGDPVIWTPNQDNPFFDFAEGWAHYLDSVFFKYLYPHNLRNNAASSCPSQTPYFRGKRKIEQLVTEHGEPILFEIPKNWRRLGE